MLCSIVCMTPTGKVFVVKAKDTAVIPNIWSCGIFETNSNEIIDKTAEKYYMEEFNADINIIYQPMGESHRPIPISTFTINAGTEENPIYIEGVYLAAILRNPNQIILSDNYSEFKVLDLAGLVTEIGNVGIIPDLFFNIMTVINNCSIVTVIFVITIIFFFFLLSFKQKFIRKIKSLI